jgi:hypothetical protein
VMPVLSTNTMQRDTVADRFTSRVAAALGRPVRCRPAVGSGGLPAPVPAPGAGSARGR